MTVFKMLVAAGCALFAGVLVENAKANSTCAPGGATGAACAQHIVVAAPARSN